MESYSCITKAYSFSQVVMIAYSISLDVAKQSCIIPLSRDNGNKVFHKSAHLNVCIDPSKHQMLQLNITS